MSRENKCCEGGCRMMGTANGVLPCSCPCHKNQEKTVFSLSGNENWHVPENQERDEWEEELNKKFSKWDWYPYHSADLKSFISNLLHKQRQELVEVVEKLSATDSLPHPAPEFKIGFNEAKSLILSLLSNPKGDE